MISSRSSAHNVIVMSHLALLPSPPFRLPFFKPTYLAFSTTTCLPMTSSNNATAGPLGFLNVSPRLPFACDNLLPVLLLPLRPFPPLPSLRHLFTMLPADSR